MFAKLGFDPDLAWRISRMERYRARDFDVTSRLRLGFLVGARISALAIFAVQRNRTLNILDAVEARPARFSFASGSDALAFRWWRTKFGRAWWRGLHARTEGVQVNAAGRNILKYHLAGLGFDSGIVDLVFGEPQET